MIINIYKGRELHYTTEVDNSYYEKTTLGIDKALEHIFIKMENISINEIPNFLLERYSDEEAKIKYIENTYKPFLNILENIKFRCITNEKIEIRYEWFEYGINEVFKRYCGFSLLKETLFSHAFNNVVDLFYKCGGLSEKYDNREIKYSENGE